MNLVQKAWEMDDASQVQKLLNATRHRPGETDLRGIEWHYWQRMLHQEDRVLQLPLRLMEKRNLDSPSGFRSESSASIPNSVAELMSFSHDGRRLAAITRFDDPANTDLVLKVWSTESDSIEPIFSRNLPYKTKTAFALPAGASARLDTPLDTRQDSCEIVFLDAERVVIGGPNLKISDITELLKNATDRQELQESNEELRRLRTGDLALFELQTFRLETTQPTQAHPPIPVRPRIAFNQDGSRIATPSVISKEGESQPQWTILIFDGRTGEQIDQLPSPFPNAMVRALSPDATRIVVANFRTSFQSEVQTNPVTDRQIQIAILDVATRNSVTVSPRSMQLRYGEVPTSQMEFSTAFSPDGTRLAVDHYSAGTVAILDAATGSELFSIYNDVNKNNPFSVFTRDRIFLAFSPDGKWLTSTSGVDRSTNGLKVWEVATGKLGAEFKGHTSAPSRVAFSADSKQLLVADQGGAVKVWRVPAKSEAVASALAISEARRNGDVDPP